MITKIIVLVIGIALIGFISWWFFGKHEKEAVTADVADNVQEVTVKVDGGYSPETVVLKKGVPAVINFYRKILLVVWNKLYSLTLVLVKCCQKMKTLK